MTVGMVDPRGQIVRECGYPVRLPRKSIALTYAFAIRQEPSADFGEANTAIIARYGARGLDAIKRLAWDYVLGRKQP